MSDTRPYVRQCYIDQYVTDIIIVARHVSKQPRGYLGQQAELAKVLLQRVDLEALKRTCNGVYWAMKYIDNPTRHEKKVAMCADRLEHVMVVIELYQKEISELISDCAA